MPAEDTPGLAGLNVVRLRASVFHERWEHETGNRQLKTNLRGPGWVLRSQSPDMMRQEIFGYLLAHYAISALI